MGRGLTTKSEQQTDIATTRPTRLRGPSWWKVADRSHFGLNIESLLYTLKLASKKPKPIKINPKLQNFTCALLVTLVTFIMSAIWEGMIKISISRGLKGEIEDKHFLAIWYYMTRCEKSGKGEKRWGTFHFCCLEPWPTTPAAVWYIIVFIIKLKI